MKTIHQFFRIISISLVILMLTISVSAQPRASIFGTSFTYQGSLIDGGSPADGSYDFEFNLYDALTGGILVRGPVDCNDVKVKAGLFTVQLDFGDPFDGSALYLEVAVRPGASEDEYTILEPRQELTATPYAFYARNADELDGQEGSYYRDASNISAGTLATSRYSAYDDLNVDGYLGNAAGDLARNNSILQSTLNADLLDGLNTGNASGNIPISNGTLNTNLYAAQAPWSGLTGVPAGFGDGVDNGSAYQNVVVVAKSGGDYTTIQAALDSITGANDTNRYLVVVAPGVYSERVTMVEYVDIQGSGELTTKITYGGTPTGTTGGTLNGTNNSEVRFLTVENTGGDNYAYAVVNNYASPRLTHVTVSASGGTMQNQGIVNDNSSPTLRNITVSATGSASNTGISNSYSSPIMEDINVSASGSEDFSNVGINNLDCSSLLMMNVTASAIGGGDISINNYGIYNARSSLTLINVTASGSGDYDAIGVANWESSITVKNSTLMGTGGISRSFGLFNESYNGSHTVHINSSQIFGSTRTIHIEYGTFSIRIGASLLSGGPASSGTVTCAGVYDETYTFYPSTCP